MQQQKHSEMLLDVTLTETMLLVRMMKPADSLESVYLPSCPLFRVTKTTHTLLSLAMEVSLLIMLHTVPDPFWLRNFRLTDHVREDNDDAQPCIIVTYFT
jgi:hypothetical protein